MLNGGKSGRWAENQRQGGAAGTPGRLEVEEGLEDLVAKIEKFRGLSVTKISH